VQKVRESAASAECRNNLKQIGIALHKYHETAKKFPPSVITRAGGTPLNDTDDWAPTGRFSFLPNMEQDNVYNPYSTAISNYKNDGNRTWTACVPCRSRRSSVRWTEHNDQFSRAANRETGWARATTPRIGGSGCRIITLASQPE